REGHDILAFDPSRATPAGQIELCQKNDIRDNAGAEWIAIAPRALARSIEPLAAHRRKTGLEAKGGALEDVEDDFADAAVGPEGTRSFLAFTQDKWKKKPRFVLLVGDASHDGRPADATWAVLPTVLVDSFENGATASDAALAPAGVAIGRFPAR